MWFVHSKNIKMIFHCLTPSPESRSKASPGPWLRSCAPQSSRASVWFRGKLRPALGSRPLGLNVACVFWGWELVEVTSENSCLVEVKTSLGLGPSHSAANFVARFPYYLSLQWIAHVTHVALSAEQATLKCLRHCFVGYPVLLKPRGERDTCCPSSTPTSNEAPERNHHGQSEIQTFSHKHCHLPLPSAWVHQ